jgi:3-hydroxy acid dehydrogenase / malonic semialdehyde reductase
MKQTKEQLMSTPIAFITGATSGIGKATAIRFAKDGYRLILAARRTERLDTLKSTIQTEQQTEVLTLTLDIQNNSAVTQAIDNLSDEWKHINVLVNNAGTAITTDSIHEADPKNWDTMIDTNIKGLLYVTRAILPGMLDRNNGHIINIGSIAGHECYPGGNIYSATKHAVKAINKSLRLDLLGKPIRVTSVDPGMVHTEFSAVRWNDHDKAEKFYADITTLQPEDIADAVAYCAQVPKHVNIEDMIVMPTCQASVNHVYRKNSSESSTFANID